MKLNLSQAFLCLVGFLFLGINQAYAAHVDIFFEKNLKSYRVKVESFECVKEFREIAWYGPPDDFGRVLFETKGGTFHRCGYSSTTVDFTLTAGSDVIYGFYKKCAGCNGEASLTRIETGASVKCSRNFIGGSWSFDCDLKRLDPPGITQAEAGGYDSYDNYDNHSFPKDKCAGIAGDGRFVSDAVDASAYCDRKTGLVWESNPSDEGLVWGPEQETPDFSSAILHCNNLNVGGDKGPKQKRWRLPSGPELTSLIDTDSSTCGSPDFLCLPDGHPFTNVQLADYWSASTSPDFIPEGAWLVNFGPGDADGISNKDQGGFHAWCVRGRMNPPPAPAR